LPDAFILKASHGSGWNVVCRSRSSFDFPAAAAQLSRYLRTSYYSLGREWVYKDLNPRILCERLLLDGSGAIPEDYKFYCFHGEPKLVQVDYTRHESRTLNYHDAAWSLLPCRRQAPNNLKAPRDPPPALPDMLDAARRLAKPFPFVRVDLYAVGPRVFFGELTFFPGRGITAFTPLAYEYTFGRLLDLGRIRGHVV
jgi:hypothetical protein